MASFITKGCKSSSKPGLPVVQESFFNKKFICFLCLVSEAESLSDEDFELKTVSLRNVCRYLNVNSNVQSSLDFIVLLCPTCSNVVKSITPLIQQLDSIQQQLSQKVQVLNQILLDDNTKSGNFVERDQLRKQALGVSMKNLRDDIRNKCAKQTGKNIPTTGVKIQKNSVPVEGSKPSTSQTRPRTVITYREDLTEDESIDEEENDNTILPKPSPSVNSASTKDSQNSIDPPELTPVARKFNQIFDKFAKQVKSGDMKPDVSRLFPDFKKYSTKCHVSGLKAVSNDCPFCSAIVTKLNHHLITVHTEKFFLAGKLDNVSEATLLEYCNKNVFFPIYQKSKRQPKTPQKGSNGGFRQDYICMFCNCHLFTNQYDMKYHLVVRHWDIFQERLIQAQKTGNIKNTIRIRTKRDSKPAGVVNKSVEPPPIHRKVSHAFLVLQRICKTSKTGNKLICKACGDHFVSDSPQNFRVHTCVNHPEMLFRRYMQEDCRGAKFAAICKNLMDSEVEACGSNRICKYCHSESATMSDLIFHLFMHHFEDLGKKVENSQKDKELKPVQIAPKRRRRRRVLRPDTHADLIEIKLERGDAEPLYIFDKEIDINEVVESESVEEVICKRVKIEPPITLEEENIIQEEYQRENYEDKNTNIDEPVHSMIMDDLLDNEWNNLTTSENQDLEQVPRIESVQGEPKTSETTSDKHAVSGNEFATFVPDLLLDLD